MTGRRRADGAGAPATIQESRLPLAIGGCGHGHAPVLPRRARGCQGREKTRGGKAGGFTGPRSPRTLPPGRSHAHTPVGLASLAAFAFSAFLPGPVSAAPFVTRDGFYSYSAIPEAEDLYARQSRELDRRKREAMLHQIQRLIHDRVTHAPLMESAFLWAIGPRVEEPGLSLIPGRAYSAPYEDVKLKRP